MVPVHSLCLDFSDCTRSRRLNSLSTAYSQSKLTNTTLFVLSPLAPNVPAPPAPISLSNPIHTTPQHSIYPHPSRMLSSHAQHPSHVPPEIPSVYTILPITTASTLYPFICNVLLALSMHAHYFGGYVLLRSGRPFTIYERPYGLPRLRFSLMRLVMVQVLDLTLTSVP